MIDEAKDSGKKYLRNIENIDEKDEIRRLKLSLNKAVKKSSLWQSKFFHLKEKIFTQTQKMTEEVNKSRKYFESKMKNYFKKYSQMLKEIVVSNSQVRNFFKNFF